MRVFISHSHEEQKLAEAWSSLFKGIAYGLIDTWYSSDQAPAGGMGPGRWREKIGRELEGAEVVLAIFTPESVNRPWIFFESAFALGLAPSKVVIPIVYYMDMAALPSPLQDLQSYYGDDRNQVIDLCKRLCRPKPAESVDPERVKRWSPDLDSYIEQIEAHRAERLNKALFYGDFHTSDTAEKLVGPWFAKWTQLHDDGRETLWQLQPVTVENTGWRIRMVGTTAQGGLSPFEGVVSSKGHIALSYWSREESAICGTVLLELIGTIMEGTWQGFTAKTMRERLSIVKGRVVMSRKRAEVEEYWDRLP